MTVEGPFRLKTEGTWGTGVFPGEGLLRDPWTWEKSFFLFIEQLKESSSLLSADWSVGKSYHPPSHFAFSQKPFSFSLFEILSSRISKDKEFNLVSNLIWLKYPQVFPSTPPTFQLCNGLFERVKRRKLFNREKSETVIKSWWIFSNGGPPFV